VRALVDPQGRGRQHVTARWFADAVVRQDAGLLGDAVHRAYTFCKNMQVKSERQFIRQGHADGWASKKLLRLRN
jgi:hypothetical protein